MEGTVKDSLPDVAGFYTQPYNEIVKPDRVWAVSKYFLRRWVPHYLGPTRFWLVVAARHLAYLNGGGRKRFRAHDAHMIAEASCSRRTYYRAKAEMDEASNPLSLFVRREETQYESKQGKARPMPTAYHVRLDDVLTPGDAIHLASWMQAQKVERKPEAIAELLSYMLTLSETELLAPSLRPFADEPPAQFKALTAADVVQRVFGNKVLADKVVYERCDALQTHLTGTTYIGKQYFRQHWVDELGPGPAYLLVYLRSYCFLDETASRLRNEITTTRPELADAVGIDRVTLFRWLKKIAQTTPADQPFSPFLEELDASRAGGNDVEIRLKVELREPLTAKSLTEYRSVVASLDLSLQNGTHENEEIRQPALQNGTHSEYQETESPLQNGTHENGGSQEAVLQNGTHNEPASPEFALQNGTHENGEESGPVLQNGTDTATGVAKWHSQEGSVLQNGTTGVAKWHSFKHYKHLLGKTLKEETTNTFAATAIAHPDLVAYWKIDEAAALRPFAEAAVGDLAGFCDAVGIYGLTSRTAVVDSGLTLAQVVAWYLYGLTQPKLTAGGAEQLPGYVINRVREKASGIRPPAEFERLASMSWELWRCYACLLLLPTTCTEGYVHDPLFTVWVKHYGRARPEDLPFDVGVGVAEFVAQLPDDLLMESIQPEVGEAEPAQARYRMSADEAGLWKSALGELEPQMAKATFNTWLRDSILRLTGDGGAVVLVRNEYAAEWINGRLQETIARTLSAVAGRTFPVVAAEVAA